ncbi:MAG: AAA family ATPase [Limnohabitans sp.]|nr:AAA family ATPase [Limnohabitans sp.]
MKKQNPISSLFENSLESLKNYIDNQLESTDAVIDVNFVIQLKSDAYQLLQLCKELNQDQSFVQHINDLVGQANDKNVWIKTEHFLLSDLVSILKNKSLDKKQLFAFAYYYDVLRNEIFADEKAISTLNKIIQSEKFSQNIAQLQNHSKIGNQEKYILNSLNSLNHSKKDTAQKLIEKSIENILGQSATTEIQKMLQETIKEEPKNPAISYPPNEDSLEKVMAELNGMIGLENIKKDISELINLLEIQKKRSGQGLPNIDIALHTVFLGPPGTGKTSVARLLSRIFKILGFLSKGQLYETDREGLVAGYVGQTAIKVDKVTDESIGGVLFIDEAYSLTQNALGNDYGSEAINTILKRMEDNRDDLAVVVAGYTEPMQLFVESNPGLRSRFNRYFHFEHFKPQELFQIFESLCKKTDFVLTDDAIEKLQETFELLYEKKDEGFGNARVVRNLFEKCVQNQANRVIKIQTITKDVLRALTEEDIPEPKETVQTVFFSLKEE